MSGKSNYQYGAGFPDVFFPQIMSLSILIKLEIVIPHILLCSLILHRTPVTVTTAEDSRNNLTASMESLQERTQSQIQFQGLGDHEWEARDKIANMTC